jgi:hypothetical protein
MPSLPHERQTITLPSGSLVKTFAIPSAEFNLLTASDRELALYGFPRRPNEPRLRELWNDTFSRRKHFITPVFEFNNDVRPVLSPTSPDVTNPIWCGVQVATSGDPFQYIFTVVTVPNAIAGPYLPAAVSVWVGLLSSATSDLLQAGVGWLFDGGPGQFFAWSEWLPDNLVIKNFPVSPGDTLAVLICATSPTSAFYSFLNETTGVATSYEIDAPTGRTLQADNAQWIVERQLVNGAIPNLAEFGDVYFDNAIAATQSGNLLYPSNSSPITMQDDQQNILATATIETATLIQVKYTGR